MNTPGTQVAVVYEKGGKVGARKVLVEKEFATARQATTWVAPWIIDGYPFDICRAEYLNAKRAQEPPHA